MLACSHYRNAIPHKTLRQYGRQGWLVDGEFQEDKHGTFDQGRVDEKHKAHIINRNPKGWWDGQWFIYPGKHGSYGAICWEPIWDETAA